MKLNYVIDIKFTDEDSTEPVNLPEARAWLKISNDITDDNSILADLITASRMQCESYLNISLIPRTVTATLQNDSGEILIPYGPMQKADDDADTIDFISIKDDLGTTISTDNYRLIGEEFKRLNTSPLGSTGAWAGNNFWAPACSKIVATYKAGYDFSSSFMMKFVFKNAILKQIAWLYEHRGEEGVQDMSPAVIISLKPHRKVS